MQNGETSLGFYPNGCSLKQLGEPCATNAECQRVHRSGRTGDIAVDMINSTFRSEDFAFMGFRLRRDRNEMERMWLDRELYRSAP